MFCIVVVVVVWLGWMTRLVENDVCPLTLLFQPLTLFVSSRDGYALFRLQHEMRVLTVVDSQSNVR